MLAVDLAKPHGSHPEIPLGVAVERLRDEARIPMRLARPIRIAKRIASPSLISGFQCARTPS